MHYFIVAFLAGLACKLYDDLSDNPLLAEFKSPELIEYLKGVHYILATTLSLHNPVCFMLIYMLCGFNSLADPQAYSNPYESSMLYSFAIVYLLINYDDLTSLNFYDVCCIPFVFLGMAIDNYFFTQEYSLCKLITRAIFACITLCITVLPLNSVTLKYIFMYGIGYLLCSAVVQYYSLLTYYRKPKPKSKRSKRIQKI